MSREQGEDVVIVPLSDFESLDETAYLLRSPANAAHLKPPSNVIRKNA